MQQKISIRTTLYIISVITALCATFSTTLVIGAPLILSIIFITLISPKVTPPLIDRPEFKDFSIFQGYPKSSRIFCVFLSILWISVSITMAIALVIILVALFGRLPSYPILIISKDLYVDDLRSPMLRNAATLLCFWAIFSGLGLTLALVSQVSQGITHCFLATHSAMGAWGYYSAIISNIAAGYKSRENSSSISCGLILAAQFCPPRIEHCLKSDSHSSRNTSKLPLRLG